jgi:VWFA-related protein
MSIRISAACILVALSLVQAGSMAPLAAQQQPAAPAAAQPQAPPPGEPAAAQDPANPQQPTFRGGINFVRVDVIVTDRKSQPVTDLKETDFEILEDGKPQAIEQFRLIKVDGNLRPGESAPRQIRTREDEETEAAREDVRIFVFFLDDYHVRRSNSMSVRDPLIRFVETQLRPTDMVAVMYPLTPLSALSFTRNHESVISALRSFEGRKYDYSPKNQMEANYMRYPTETVERIRNDVVMGALQGLSVRLGGLREGRKSVIFVSEGFTAMLPPQMRRGDASMPANPIESRIAAGAQDGRGQMTAEWFGQMDVYSRLREVFDAANRNNTAFYSLDPRGLTPFEFGFDDLGAGVPAPSFATDSRALQMTQDTLRTLSEETDGRAIVNRNTLEQGLAEMVRDSSSYYLIGYNSSVAVNDGKFHEIKVRVKRGGVDTRARKGYWALTPADAVRATAAPTPDVANPVRDALASIATSVQAAKYVRTWVGTERGTDGKTRVTLIWEPLPANGRREQPGRLSVIAADPAGSLVFRGRSPDAALAAAAAAPSPNDTGATSARTPAPAPTVRPQRIVFDAPPGKLELRMTVEAAGTGGTLDSEIRTIEVPDLTAPQAAISTPRVFRARTAREMQATLADASAVPAATREFSRTERLLIRFDAYGPGSDQPAATAVLLNRAGQKMSDLPVAAATAGGTHQIEFGLGSMPAGEYLVQITVKGTAGEAQELVPLRVTS